MIPVYVNDIMRSLQNKCYFSALSLTLTLPDICGAVEFPNESVGKRYIEWYDKYIGSDEACYGEQLSENNPWLSGVIVYNLRNTFLHTGTPNIINTKIKEKRNQLDRFFLILGDGTQINQASTYFEFGTELAAVIAGVILFKYMGNGDLAMIDNSTGVTSITSDDQPVEQDNGFLDSPDGECPAPFTVEASPDASCYVTMTLHDDTSKAYSLFVNAGATAKVSVPLGSYDMYYCTGTTWYGQELLFGNGTAFYKTEQVFDFIQTEEGFQGHIVKLQTTITGNLPTEKIGESKFPK